MAVRLRVLLERACFYCAAAHDLDFFIGDRPGAIRWRLMPRKQLPPWAPSFLTVSAACDACTAFAAARFAAG